MTNSDENSDTKCEYNGYEFERDTSKETRIYEMVQMGIKNISNNKSTQIKPDKLFDGIYMPFVLKTTEQMFKKTSFHKLKPIHFEQKYVENTETFTLLETQKERRNINIIAFGKSLLYLLKYIFFHFQNHQNDLNVFICCDYDSFAYYNKENIFAPDHEPRQVSKPSDETAICFRDYIKYKMKLEPEEINVLNGINIYFASSTHVLTKGVGGKRALIQYYMCRALSEDEKCMTIDDNIVQIFDKSKEIKRKIDGYYTNCYKNTANKEIHISLYDLYLRLEQKMEENKDEIFVGIEKGAGSAFDSEEVNSTAIYKLNLAKPHKLVKLNYYYNPYFTRFYEDIGFNILFNNKKHIKKYSKYMLHFGHFDQPPTKCYNNKDYNVSFESKDEKFWNKYKIEGIEPVYIMYLLFFVCFFEKHHDKIKINLDVRNAQIVLIKITYNNNDLLSYPLQTKYKKYHFIYYFSVFLYLWKIGKNPANLCILPTNKKGSSETYEAMSLSTLLSTQFAEYNQEGNRVTYRFTDRFDFVFDLYEYEITNLKHICAGDAEFIPAKNSIRAHGSHNENKSASAELNFKRHSDGVTEFYDFFCNVSSTTKNINYLKSNYCETRRKTQKVLPLCQSSHNHTNKRKRDNTPNSETVTTKKRKTLKKQRKTKLDKTKKDNWAYGQFWSP